MTRKVHTGATIAAIATPPGKGAIGIVRVSGPDAIAIASECFHGARDPALLPGFSAAAGNIARGGQVIDEALCLVMRAPQSYTREEMVEFHCHGGTATLAAVLETVIAAGARPAEPGEFTRRAFLSGRIDLARAEAVADLVTSRTDAARRQAMAQLQGGLSQKIAAAQSELRDLAARLEAGIDFSDEEDVVAVTPGEMENRIQCLIERINGLLKDAARGRRLREGARVVIAGRPNVGKSTLMNALLGSERVIVSPWPGTTRDVVEDEIEIGGVAVRLFDTAGIRENADEVERLGVERARSLAAGADLALLVVDGSSGLGEEDEAVRSALSGPVVVVVNKDDLENRVNRDDIEHLAAEAETVRVSALKCTGMDELTRAISRALHAGDESTETPLLSNLRHVQALEQAREALGRAGNAVAGRLSDEFIAADLSAGLHQLGLITGESAEPDLLDIIFSRFCIGK